MKKKHKTLRFKLTALTISIFLLICVLLTAVSIASSGMLTSAAGLTPALPTTGAMPTEPGANVQSQTLAQAQRNFNLIAIGAMILLAVAGSGCIYLTVRRELHPLEELARQVSGLDADNLDASIHVKVTGDEVEQLAVALDDMTRRVSDAYTVQKNFSANAAHELRTPLTVMQTQLDVFAMKKDRSREEYEKLFDVLRANTDRFSGLVSDLSSFTNEQAVDMSKQVDLRGLMEEIVFELEGKSREKKLTVTIAGDGAVYGSDSLLQRAFYNLVSNAIRYNVEGGSVCITLSDKQVSIADTGIGIPDDAKPNVFNSFFCVDKSRSRELGGSGLGLAIAKNIMEKHGGYIYVTDNQPKGSVFVAGFDKEGLHEIHTH